MKADAIYVVITPHGLISDTSAFNEGQATRYYVRKWMPDRVSLSDYVADQLWREFEKVGYKVHRIDLPKALEGKEICHT